MNNEDTDLDDEIDEHHLEDAVMEENTVQDLDSNEYQENNGVLVEDNKEINEYSSEELAIEVTTEDNKNSTSNNIEGCSHKEEESCINNNIMNDTSKDNNNKEDK